MGVTRVGPFKLIDPPAGQVESIQSTVRAIKYPWARLLPVLRRDPDNAVVVRWDPAMQQGATGLFYGSTYEIHLGTRYAGWERNAPFVFAHEVGHLIDRATLGRDERKELTLVLHASDETYRRDDDRINGEPYDHAHTQPHNEDWTRRDKHYYLMLNEAYADLFVAAFAPSLFKRPRFTHWTSDLEAIRSITLGRTIMAFNDVGEDNVHRDNIEDLAVHGVIDGFDDGSFKPGQPVTRGQVASIVAKALDVVKPDWRE